MQSKDAETEAFELAKSLATDTRKYTPYQEINNLVFEPTDTGGIVGFFYTTKSDSTTALIHFQRTSNEFLHEEISSEEVAKLLDQ